MKETHRPTGRSKVALAKVKREYRKASSKKRDPVNFDALPASSFIREAQLLNGVLPFSRATLWRRVAAKEFPRPVNLGGNTTAWRVGAVREWLEEKAAQLEAA